MKCFLFIPENDLEDQISKNICWNLRKVSLAKVYFFHPHYIQELKKQDYPEIKSDITLPSIFQLFPKVIEWYRMIRTLRRRRRFRETIILIGHKTCLLLWIFFVMQKKPIFIRITSHFGQNFSWLDGFL